MAFGLVSTGTTSSYASLNSRRKIFYQYPTGAMPLMGLLSMLPSEETDKVNFGWWERRFPVQRTATVASGTAPFLNGDGTPFADASNFVANTEYRVNVVSTDPFKPTHVIELRNIALAHAGTPATTSIRGTVVEINSTTQLTFRPYSAVTSVDNRTTDNNGKTIAIIGTANAEGGRSGTGVIQFPINPTNLTQIFRTAFNITRTALKTGLQFDKSGPYKMQAKENGLRHMIEMEKAFLFGEQHTVLVTDPDTGDVTPETKTGGVIDFLRKWEAANSIYRGGSGAPAVTLNTDDNKRIIDLGGTMTKGQYNTYVSRAFRKTSDKAYEKLVLCGGTFLEVVNSLFERDIVRTTLFTEKSRNAEFIVHSHTTLRGTVHYKVHPLFDEDPDLQGNALFLDMGNLMYRPLTDSDTVFLKGRQETDRDGRKDEWITEAGLECRFPESHEYLMNVLAAA